MTKKKSTNYAERAETLLVPITGQLGLEIVDVEYVREAGNWYMRAYIDKEGGVTVDDCEKVSRLLEEQLDRADFIADSYILEVSSPGLGRVIKKERDFARALGKMVEIHTFRPVQKEKTWIGELKSYNDQEVVLLPEDREEVMTFSRKEIALIRNYF